MKAIHKEFIIPGAIGVAALAVSALAAVFVPVVAADNDGLTDPRASKNVAHSISDRNLGLFRAKTTWRLIGELDGATTTA